VSVELLNGACYYFAVRIIEAHYENGLLRPKSPLALRLGERVGVIVVRWPDPARWDLRKIGALADSEDVALAEAGLGEWLHQIDEEE
jgi:predicted DNA-binding antitoxin AbrB/MazE fold protein